MIHSRHRAREIALQILYQYDPSPPHPKEEELIQELQEHYSHFRVPENLRDFIGQLVAGTLHHLAALDEILEKYASNWKITRMSTVDRCLLRMATYEMIYLSESSPLIVIDEAIELAKQFGAADSSSFINGVLDSIRIHVKVPTQAAIAE